jgi:hypothetical protein
MGKATAIAIDEASKQDLQWFIACARAVNGTVSIYKCLQPRIHLYVDASLHGLGGLWHVCIYTYFRPPTQLEYCALGGHQYFCSFTGIFSQVFYRANWSPSGATPEWRCLSSRQGALRTLYFMPLLETSGFGSLPLTERWSSSPFWASLIRWRTFCLGGRLLGGPWPLYFPF